MSYVPNTPPVLKGVNFTFRGGEKIGVVGRTGAGKSTLIMAMFRLAELTEGRIQIDGITTTTLSMKELRSRIAIIPQVCTCVIVFVCVSTSEGEKGRPAVTLTSLFSVVSSFCFAFGS
jgi:ABC-type cobalamin/Fe3+-siderophores transport system ATPase subunit